MVRETWRATVHRVAKSRTRLKQLSAHIEHTVWCQKPCGTAPQKRPVLKEPRGEHTLFCSIQVSSWQQWQSKGTPGTHFSMH